MRLKKLLRRIDKKISFAFISTLFLLISYFLNLQNLLNKDQLIFYMSKNIPNGEKIINFIYYLDLTKIFTDTLLTIFIVVLILRFRENINNKSSILINKFFRKVNFIDEKVIEIFKLVTYLYLLWRMLSRNYAVYSFTQSAYLKSDRLYLNFSELLVKPYELFSFQFIHRFFLVPNYTTILNLQLLLISLCAVGIVLKNNKFISLLVLVLTSYLSGFVLMTGAELDGSELLICALIAIFSLNYFDNHKKYIPILGFNWLVGFYYFSSGINKLIDVGISFIWDLNLDERIFVSKLESFHLSGRYSHEIFRYIEISPMMSNVAGLFTILFELSMLLVFFNSKNVKYSIFGLIGLHTLVFLLVGINFTGNTVFLLLLLFVLYKLEFSDNIKKN